MTVEISHGLSSVLWIEITQQDGHTEWIDETEDWCRASKQGLKHSAPDRTKSNQMRQTLTGNEPQEAQVDDGGGGGDDDDDKVR